MGDEGADTSKDLPSASGEPHHDGADTIAMISFDNKIDSFGVTSSFSTYPSTTSASAQASIESRSVRAYISIHVLFILSRPAL